MKEKNTFPSFADYFAQTRKFTGKEIFLDKIDKIIDWKKIDKILRKYPYKKSAVGAPAYSPLLLFKILLLQQWYNLGDPETEAALYDRISFMRFTGLGFNDSVPDHSTFCRFRSRLRKLKLTKKLFKEINNQLISKKLIVNNGVIVDATVVQSSRKPKKTIVIDDIVEDRKEENGHIDSPHNSKVTVEYSKDMDATWTKKGSKYHYGYKCHISSSLIHNFIVSGHVTPANKSDTGEFIKLVQNSKLKKNGLVSGDKGYTSKKNSEFLSDNDYIDMIMKKKPRNKNMAEEDKILNRFISSFRYRVETIFGDLKAKMGFNRMRYLGLERCEQEFYLKAMSYNIRKACNLAIT